MLAGSIIVFGVITLASRITAEMKQKRAADARRRQSMREVAERWHFREWERDLRSSDSL